MTYMTDISRLKQLIIIAKCGTISEASNILHLSQPTLSRSMQKLEEELDVTLFHRYKNKIELTCTGKLTVKYAEEITSRLEMMVEHIQANDRECRTISIGAVTPPLLWNIGPLISQQYPHMIVSTVIQDDETLLNDFRLNKLKLIIISQFIQERSLVCRKLAQEQLYYNVPQSHRLAGADAVSFSDINGDSILINTTENYWYPIYKAHLPASKIILQENGQLYGDLLRASNLTSFSSSLVAKHHPVSADRVNLPITDADALVNYYFVCQKSQYPAFKDICHKFEYN